ncbi:MAG: hypothetical protein P1V97_01665 [Planctomycetota bacterium]|nr:hypothetical protein [Planctomycetota bacterium]
MKANKSFVLCIFGFGFVGGSALGVLGAGEVKTVSPTSERGSQRNRRGPGSWGGPRIALAGQTERNAPRMAARTKTGKFRRIRGRVTDRRGEAVSGALVEVQLPPSMILDRGSPPDQTARQSYVRQFLQLKSSESTARSDKNGFFEIPQFTESSDRITLTKPGYLFQRQFAEQNKRGVQIQFIAYNLAELIGETSELDDEDQAESKVQFQVYDPNGNLLNRASIYWENEDNSDDFDWTQENNSAAISPGRYNIYASVEGFGTSITSDKQSVLIGKEGRPQSMSFTVNQLPEDYDSHVLFVRFKGLQVIPPEDEDDEPEVKYVYYALVPYLGPIPNDYLLTRRFRDMSRETNRDRNLDDLDEGKYMLLCGRGRGSFEFKQAIVIAQPLTVVEVQLPKEIKSPLKIRGYGPNGEILKDLTFGFNLVRHRWSDDFNLPSQLKPDGSYSVLVPYFAPSKELVENEDTIQAYSDEYGILEALYQPGQTEMTFQFKERKSLTLRVSGFHNCGAVGTVYITCDGNQWEFKTGSEDSQSFELAGGQDDALYFRVDVLNHKLERQTVYSKDISLSGRKNRAEVVLPKFYPLKIQSSLEPETEVYLEPLGALSELVSSMEPMNVDANGRVQFINLPAGQYKVQVDELSMVVTVPSSGIIPFQTKSTNALEVSINDSRGYLASRGFKDRDIIVGINGKRYPNTNLDELIEGYEGSSVSFLVDRQGRTLEIVADPKKLISIEKHLGGKLREKHH